MDSRDLTKKALVIDAHNDTIVAHVWHGGVSISGSGDMRACLSSGVMALLKRCGMTAQSPRPLQLDMRRMRKAGIDAAFFAIDVSPAYHNRLTYALDGFGALLTDLEQSGEQVRIVRQAADIEEAKVTGQPAIILAIEHAGATEGSLNVLRALYELGVRAIGLTHNISSVAADGVGEARDGVGLTTFGVRLIEEMNRLGMLVDLAHVSESAFYHALQVSSKPVIFSHGNARALCDHPRNLTDSQLEALGQNGGVIGLSFVPFFVAQENPSLERFLDHVDHVVKVAGVETVGLGSDFDGGGTLLDDATELHRVTEGLILRGYGLDDVHRMLGGNTLRVLRATIG